MILLSPTHRLMLIYDINPQHHNRYYRFMLGEFVPAMQKMGMHMIYAWQVISDDLPERQVEFVCEGEDVARGVLNGGTFLTMEKQLQEYTQRYRRKLVIFANRCQI